MRDKLSVFNSMRLLDKREVLYSFEKFMEHHRQKDNEEGYSESKREVLLELCERFYKKIEKIEVPSLIKPWHYYQYSVTNDSIELSLLKCEEFELDDTGELSSQTDSIEYRLAEVKCDYFSVEQYAELYKVKTTTVRQWIRRGKLRTAKKNGRDWLIPTLTDKPKRGFSSVTYRWESPIDDVIIDRFSFLDDAIKVSIFQDENNKKVFKAVAFCKNSKAKEVNLTAKDREQLEIMLISAPNVEAEDWMTGIIFCPDKETLGIPILCGQKQIIDFEFSNIIIERCAKNIVSFSPADSPNDSRNYDYVSIYLIPIEWNIWGLNDQNEDSELIYSVIEEKDFTSCVKLGELSGHLILCRQMIDAGLSPWEICDAESGELESLMSTLISEHGPLNETTGDPTLNVFYIDELTIEESLRGKGLGSRILRELPSLCLEFLHTVPDIVAYHVHEVSPNRKSVQRTVNFYRKNGLTKMHEGNIMYAYINDT